MKSFMDKDFMLNNETAKTLYHDFAAKMPILDYHCHINPQEIYEDRKFDNITQVWLGGDHYKWRQLRSNGIDEKYITGSETTDREKFQKWAETMPKLIGNPLYHWSHLELQKYFGFTGYLNADSAEEVWNLTSEKLQNEWSVRKLIKASNVTLICTTDDPVDSLEWHKKIASDSTFDVQVLPAWRPDKAMNVEKPDFGTYMAKLSAVSGIVIKDFVSLKTAILNRMAFFNECGCCVSDHALEYVMYVPASEAELDVILAKGLNGQTITKEEELKYKTAFMQFVAKEYNKMDWTMQIHYGCKRDNNAYMYQQLGADTGFDCINNYAPSAQMADFFNALSATNEIPKTILYSLNPNDNASIGTILGCFQDARTAGRLQQGAAWWFNDHEQGMTEQMVSLANLGCFGNFNGMLTDSRSFLSYTRHDYFRRILCNMIGTWVEDGKYPDDKKALKEIIENISYNNAVSYFGFKLEKKVL